MSTKSEWNCPLNILRPYVLLYALLQTIEIKIVLQKMSTLEIEVVQFRDIAYNYGRSRRTAVQAKKKKKTVDSLTACDKTHALW